MFNTQRKLDILDLLSLESDSDCAAEEEVLLYSLTAKKMKSPDNFYLSKRKTHGQFKMTFEFSDADFTNFYRLDRNQFMEVHEMIKATIDSDGCNARKPIETEEKLGVFLKYLASGDSYRKIAYDYRLGNRTVSKIVNEVSVAIWKEMQPKYIPEPTTQTWKSVASKFEQRWQFPHCVGALNGKHVIKNPGKFGPSYKSYKHTYSVVLLATVDADYKFITIDVDTMGKFSDRSIFSSSLGENMMKHTSLLPKPEQLPMIVDLVPYVFVGDETLPLSENLMRPYPRRSITGNYKHQVFNARLSHARQTVERAFGLLASQFRVFRKPFENKVETIRDVVKAACALHNYLRSSVQVSDEDVDNIEPLPQNQFIPLRGSNVRSSSNAFAVRKQFTEYFNNCGAVPWQHQTVMLGNY